MPNVSPNLDKPPSGPTEDWRTLRHWLFKLWTIVRNFDLTAAASGNTQIDGNLTVTGGINVPAGSNITGMPLSLLAAAAGEQDGTASSNGTQGGQFLGPVIAMSAVNTSAQSFTNTGALATVTGWSTVFDTASAFVPSTGIYTIPVSGLYQVSGSVLMNTITYPAAGYVQLIVVFNATPTHIYNHLNQPFGVAATSSCYLDCQVNILRRFNAGDTIFMQLGHIANAANTMYSDPNQEYNHFEILKVG
jgi:hypothetical protein